MWHAGHLRRKLNSEGNGASFLFFSLKALHASAPLSFCDLSPTKTPAHQDVIPGALSSQIDSYRRNQLLFCKHHLQHPSQLCVMHIEHCNMLTATGFESTFTITTPLCLHLLFLFYLLALLLRLEIVFWATTILPKNVDSISWWDPELLGNMAIGREYRLLFKWGCGTLLPTNHIWTCSSFLYFDLYWEDESNSAEM